MSQDEIVEVMKAYNNTIKTTWEQTRTQCFYNIVAFNGTRHIKKPQDLFLLPWEVDDKPKGNRLTRDEFMNIANKMRNGK